MLNTNKNTLIFGLVLLALGFAAGAYFKVIPTYAIDNDQDGQINILDNDDDNDGILDQNDTQSVDHDNDSIEDPSDTDDDDDAVLDKEDEHLFDHDNNGVEDKDEPEIEDESGDDNSGSGGGGDR